MAKKIRKFDIPNPYGPWNSDEGPYEVMLAGLTEGKSEKERKKLKKQFEESFTYLLIAERGRFSPDILTLQEAYEAEKKEGCVGFVNALIANIPTFFDLSSFCFVY